MRTLQCLMQVLTHLAGILTRTIGRSSSTSQPGWAKIRTEWTWTLVQLRRTVSLGYFEADCLPRTLSFASNKAPFAMLHKEERVSLAAGRGKIGLEPGCPLQVVRWSWGFLG